MKKVIASSNANKISASTAKRAASIAEDLNDLLAEVAGASNLSDFLDEYDLEHIMNAADALAAMQDAFER